jgi:hypothetical protein
MRVFTDLSCNFAPHEIVYRIITWSAGKPDFLRPVDFQVGSQPAWVIFALWAHEALSTAPEFSHSTDIFCS